MISVSCLRIPRRTATAMERSFWGWIRLINREFAGSGKGVGEYRFVPPRWHSLGPRTRGGRSSRFRGPANLPAASSRPGRPGARSHVLPRPTGRTRAVASGPAPVPCSATIRPGRADSRHRGTASPRDHRTSSHMRRGRTLETSGATNDWSQAWTMCRAQRRFDRVQFLCGRRPKLDRLGLALTQRPRTRNLAA